MADLRSLAGGLRPVLYHAPSSYYSMIARLALAEGGVDYERVFVDILLRGTQHSAAYARLNPEMTVPSLVLGERVLTQSRAVVEWALGAGEGARGGEVGYWMDLAYSFAVDELTFGGLLARHAVARAVIPRRLAAARRRLLRRAGEWPDLADVYARRAAVFAERERVFAPAGAGRLFAARCGEACGLLDQLERRLGDGRGVLVGAGYSGADVVWTVFLARLVFVGLAGEIAGRAGVARYWGAMRGRGSFAAADVWTRLRVGRVLGGMFAGALQNPYIRRRSPDRAELSLAHKSTVVP